MKYSVACPTVLLLGLLLFGSPGAMLYSQNAPSEAADGDWKILRFQDHDYISSESIRKFYGFDDLRLIKNTLWLASSAVIMKADIHSRELRINNIKFNLSYPVETIQGDTCFSRRDLSTLIDPLLRPPGNKGAAIFDTVVIDPGHGGKEGGAANNLRQAEKDLTLQLGLALKTDLEKRGLKVVMTRVKDVLVTEHDRTAAANRVPHSIFISLHMGCLAPGTGGVGTCIYSAPGVPQNPQNLLLATAIHATLTKRFNTSLADRGIEQANLALLGGINQPAVVLEPAVLSNSNDVQFIGSKDFMGTLAQTIGDAIVKYRQKLKK